MLFSTIDPGLKGAVIIVDPYSKYAYFEKLKFDKDKFLVNQFDTILGNRVERVYLEALHGRGGNSAKSTFGMGYYYGQLVHELNICSTTIEWTPPVVWTGIVHRDVLSKGNAKEKTLEAYHMYFPHDPLGKTSAANKSKAGYHDGVVDALMIAAYVLLKDNIPIPRWEFEEA